MGKQGTRSDLVDNIHDVSRPTGTSEAAALRRLRTSRPDLHEKVLAGHLSAHGAAVQAGFRSKTATIRVNDARQAIGGLLKHFSAEQLQSALTAIITARAATSRAQDPPPHAEEGHA